MRTSGGAEHRALGYSRSSLIRSGDTCWSVQAIHWFSKGKADRQAGRQTNIWGDRRVGSKRDRQRHHGLNYYSHNTTVWHSEKNELGSLLQTVPRQFSNIRHEPAQLSSVQDDIDVLGNSFMFCTPSLRRYL